MRLVAREYNLDGKTREYTMLERVDAVVIVANNVYTRGIPMVKQYRPVVKRHLLELPAGKVDPGETPAQAAGREFEEETGYRAALEKWGEFLASPGYSTETIHVYGGYVLGLAEPRPKDDDERIQVVHHHPTDLWNMVRDGEITDGKTIIALSWYRDRQSKGFDIRA